MYHRQSKKLFVFVLTISFLLGLFFFGSLTPIAYAGCATGFQCAEPRTTVQDFRSGCQGGAYDENHNLVNCTQQWNNGDWSHPRTYPCDSDCSTGWIAETCCREADCHESGCAHIANCCEGGNGPNCNLDGTCGEGEDCNNCPADCGECPACTEDTPKDLQASRIGSTSNWLLKWTRGTNAGKQWIYLGVDYDIVDFFCAGPHSNCLVKEHLDKSTNT